MENGGNVINDGNSVFPVTPVARFISAGAEVALFADIPPTPAAPHRFSLLLSVITDVSSPHAQKKRETPFVYRS